MVEASPEAMVTVPSELSRAIDCIPDEKDRHVLAAAVMGHADTIVTQNIRHFPKNCLEKFGVRCQTADDFLVRQYHLAPHLILDKLDDQAAGIAKDRAYVIASLKRSVGEFSKLVEAHVRWK